MTQPSDAFAITRSFPMQLKRRGVELRLIVGDHNRSAATVDLPPLKAVARAHRWFDEISTGKARSLADIAAREGLAVRYASLASRDFGRVWRTNPESGFLRRRASCK